MNPIVRGGAFWTPITPQTGSFFHAESHGDEATWDEYVAAAVHRAVLPYCDYTFERIRPDEPVLEVRTYGLRDGNISDIMRRKELRAEPIDPVVLLTGLRDVLTRTLGGAVGVARRLATTVPPVMADKGQPEAVLVNLATNARDAMPPGVI